VSAFECSSHTQLKALPRAGRRPCAGAECVHGSWIGRAILIVFAKVTLAMLTSPNYEAKTATVSGLVRTNHDVC